MSCLCPAHSSCPAAGTDRCNATSRGLRVFERRNYSDWESLTSHRAREPASRIAVKSPIAGSSDAKVNALQFSMASRLTRTNDARKLNTSDKKREVVRLRASSRTYKEIQELTGVDPSQAHAWVKEATTLPEDEASTLRVFEAERLGKREREIYGIFLRAKRYEDESLEPSDKASFERNQVAALATLLKVYESRRKLFGVDAPARVDVHLYERQVESMLDRLQKLVSPDEFLRLAPAIAGTGGDAPSPADSVSALDAGEPEGS